MLKAGICSVVAQHEIVEKRKHCIRIARLWRMLAVIKKVEKTAFMNKIVNEMANEAVERHLLKIKDEKARIIQRCWRGYWARKQHRKEIKALRELKETRKKRRALAFIHKH